MAIVDKIGPYTVYEDGVIKKGKHQENMTIPEEKLTPFPPYPKNQKNDIPLAVLDNWLDECSKAEQIRFLEAQSYKKMMVAKLKKVQRAYRRQQWKSAYNRFIALFQKQRG